MTMSLSEFEVRLGYKPGSLATFAQLFAHHAGYKLIRVSSGRGRHRHVARPTTSVGAMLKLVRRLLQEVLTTSLHDCVHGCVSGRSILTNARVHVSQRVILRVDIRRFFDSIARSQVETALKDGGLTQECASMVAACTTINGQLPTGFSTSPLLANLCFADMDKVLVGRAEAYSLRYSRYVDDLVFSGEMIDDEIRHDIVGRLSDGGWTVNDKKTRFMRSGGPQYVTGLSVDRTDGPHISRRMKRFLRLEVHHVAVSGFGASTIGRRHLFGLINFAKHVNPELGDRLHGELRGAGRIIGYRQEEEEVEFDEAELYWQEMDAPDYF